MSEDAVNGQSARAIGTRPLLAGAVGNVIEWYDFSLYGYMAAVLSGLFFPHEDRLVSLIATYGVFAAGFLARPLGAFLFGHLGDRIGRKAVLVVSVLLMVLPTILLGLLPTYAQWGVWAAICLVGVRILQGLSVGGEFSGSATYLAETAAPGRRGFAASFANVGSMAGMLLGAVVPAVTLALLTDAEVEAWGWRIPFLLGGVIGLVALLLRQGLPEPEPAPGAEDGPAAHQAMPVSGAPPEAPIRSLLRHEPIATLRAILYAGGYGVAFYIPMVYMPTWLSIYTDIALHEALFIVTASMLLQALLIPLAGLASDRLMPRTLLLAWVFGLLALLVAPLYLLAGGGAEWQAIAALLVFAALLAIPLGVTPSLMAETFHRRHRLTGYSVSFNIGYGVAGGTAPMVATWLIHASGYKLAPAFYMVLCALVAVATLVSMKDWSRSALR
ncbi:MFS transporter [Halochromatium sp.]